MREHRNTTVGTREHEAAGTGYDVVDSTVSCLLTRFHVRSWWGLLRCYRAFRRIRRQARGTPGLLKAVFLVEDAHTCYTLSFWDGAAAIRAFNVQVREHTKAANLSIRDLRLGSDGAQLWSAQFRLSAVSPYNLNWQGLGREVLRREVADVA
jgi:hypothetical protein